MTQPVTLKLKYLTLTDCIVSLETYMSDDTTAVMAHDGGGPETLSMNLGAYGTRPLDRDHFFVACYSEHEGKVEALVEAGIAEKVGDVVPCGYGTAQQMVLTEAGKSMVRDNRRN